MNLKWNKSHVTLFSTCRWPSMTNLHSQPTWVELVCPLEGLSGEWVDHELRLSCHTVTLISLVTVIYRGGLFLVLIQCQTNQAFPTVSKLLIQMMRKDICNCDCVTACFFFFFSALLFNRCVEKILQLPLLHYVCFRFSLKGGYIKRCKQWSAIL